MEMVKFAIKPKEQKKPRAFAGLFFGPLFVCLFSSKSQRNLASNFVGIRII